MDKSLKKKRIGVYIAFYILFGALFAWGSIGLNDLNFDKMVFDPFNGFAFTLANYGMFPMACMQLFGYTMLMAVYRPIEEAFDVAESLFSIFAFFRKNKFFKAVLTILYRVMFLAFIYGSYMGANDFWGFWLYNTYGKNVQDMIVDAGGPKAVAVIVWTALRVATIIVSYLILRKLAKKHGKALELMAVAGLAMYYSSDIINVLKEHFHRIRFREMVAYSNGFASSKGVVPNLHNTKLTRDMIANTDFHWFTHWYEIGQDDGVVWHDPRSFPSGHTSAASYSFLLVPLFTRTKELSKYFIPASIIGIGYTGAVGFSRMMRGAHYMTDVTGASLIMFTIMLIFVGILNVLQVKSDKKLNKN